MNTMYFSVEMIQVIRVISKTFFEKNDKNKNTDLCTVVVLYILYCTVAHCTVLNSTVLIPMISISESVRAF
jgi:hypothetical protein